jgi:ABC-type multidrug transport system, ATPase component
MNAIETTDLTKQYGGVTALNQVNLQVPAGSIYGFIGLNGAGKTTTMRILLNMIKATSGSVRLLGEDVQHVKNDFWNKIGYLIETPQSYSQLTTYENLELYARLREIPSGVRADRIEQYMAELGLTAYRNQRVRELSLGNRQKIGLIKALIHEPELLLLDEPTNGLDPQGLNQVRLLLQKLAKKGTTVFLSSHILAEMEQMLTHVGFLNHGRLIRQTDYQDFLGQRQQPLIATFVNADETLRAQRVLSASAIRSTCADTTLTIQAPTKSPKIIQALVTQNVVPISWQKKQIRLEDQFLAMLDSEDSNAHH